MSAPLTDGQKSKIMEQKQAASVRPIDQDPLFVQLNEKFDRLRNNAESIFLEEFNEAFGSKYPTWGYALKDAVSLRERWLLTANGSDDNRAEADAHAELIKTNQLLDTLMKRTEADWAYLHSRVTGLKCMKDGTWREVTDEISNEILFLQNRIKELVAENTRLTDELVKTDAAGLTSPATQEEGLDIQPINGQLASVAAHDAYHQKEQKWPVRADDLLMSQTEQRTAEPKPPVPCGVAVESEDSSKSEPTKEQPPAQARRAARGDPLSDDPFYKVVGVAMQAYPLVQELGRILRGKRTE